MAQIAYSRQALADLKRIGDQLAQSALPVLDTLDLIDEAISILVRHPMIGRQAGAGLRELVISQGKTGYIALYSFEAAHDAVLILAIRHQREAGYHGQPV